MATSIYPATAEAISGGIGILDFYDWKGIHCIRLWPRTPKQPNTAIQLATIDTFRRARTCPVIKSTEAKQLTQLLPTRPESTRHLYQSAIALRSFKAFSAFDALYPVSISPKPPDLYCSVKVRLNFVPDRISVLERTEFYFVAAGDVPGPLVWQMIATEPTRGNASKQYAVLPLPIAARRIDDVTLEAPGHALTLRVSKLFNPVMILAYYNIAGDRNWLIWAMPIAEWDSLPPA